jgi:methionyl-tRNA formyltransferase
VQPLRIAFAGTPDFAVPSLRALLEGPDSVVGVLTQPDRPAGRGRKLQAPPVKAAAQDAGVPVAQPESLSAPEGRQALADWAPDLLVVVAYGLILPRSVLELPRLGCINVHASLLPAYRGAAPIQRALLDGRKETGITIMQMAPGLDSGPILLQRVRPIGERETGGELHDALAELGAEALTEALDRLRQGELTPRPQEEAEATYAAKLDKAEAELDWQRPAALLDRQVRAFNPWPVAVTRVAGEPLRIWHARPGEATEQPPGRVTVTEAGEPAVAAGDGRLLVLEEIQPPGRKRMAGADALRGGYLVPGQAVGAPEGPAQETE